jgi:hypothetical protein
MKVATVEIESVQGSPYSAGRYYVAEFPKGDKESNDAHEKRTWRNRLHVADGKRVESGKDETRESFLEGPVVIPPMAFKVCLAEAAKYLNISIPGQGKATYTKHFEAGVLVLEGITLAVKASEVKSAAVHVPSDGKRGGTKRVMKYFPTIPTWKGTLTVHILDEKITKEVFGKVFNEAGKFIGIGTFRPRNNGLNGRFKVTVKTWEDA